MTGDDVDRPTHLAHCQKIQWLFKCAGSKCAGRYPDSEKLARTSPQMLHTLLGAAVAANCSASWTCRTVQTETSLWQQTVLRGPSSYTEEIYHDTSTHAGTAFIAGNMRRICNSWEWRWGFHAKIRTPASSRCFLDELPSAHKWERNLKAYCVSCRHTQLYYRWLQM